MMEVLCGDFGDRGRCASTRDEDPIPREAVAQQERPDEEPDVAGADDAELVVVAFEVVAAGVVGLLRFVVL